MKDKTSISPLLEQIADLLKKIQTNQKPIEISAETIQQLELLEKAMAAFLAINNMALKDANIDIQTLEKNSSVVTGQSPKDRRVLERAKALEREAKQMHVKLSKTLKNQQSSPQTKTEDAEKKKIKDRQKKLKRLGGDGWYRL